MQPTARSTTRARIATVIAATAALVAAWALPNGLGALDPAAGGGAGDLGSAPGEARTPVLLELFTSEGCSSCPPADRLLQELASSSPARGVEIVPLSLHVDYWNHLGWRDPFSSAEFSRRQEHYSGVLKGGRVYTPQLVIDGAVHVIGSDRRSVLAAIARAGNRSKAKVVLTVQDEDESAEPGPVTATIEVEAGPLHPLPSRTELYVAITEDGLASSVARGENAGRRLSHVAVTRSLQALGRLRPDADGRASRELTIELDPAWKRDRLHLVAWIAAGPYGRVLGTSRTTL